MSTSTTERAAELTAPTETAKPSTSVPGKRPQKAAARARGKKTTHSANKGAAVRPGSKTAKVLTLLQRPNGASLQEIRKATGWQPHSVRGFISGALRKKMGLKIRSAKRENGDRFYRIGSK